MVKITITGINSFIGSHLAKKLVTLGYSIYGIIRHVASRSLESIKGIQNDIVLLSADITDFMSFSNALKTSNPDFVLHLAANSQVRLSIESPFEYMRTNFLGTMNVCHALMELPDYTDRKLIAPASGEIYGFHENGIPLKEDFLLKPCQPYAVSKAAVDMYLRMAAQIYELNSVILRPTNTYGRKFNTNFLVEYLITSMLKGEKVYIGAPESIRDYLYVDDHVNAYIAAMEKGRKGEVYNIGSGQGTKNRDLAIKIAEKIGYDKNKIIFGAYPPGYPIRPMTTEQPYIVADITKARQELGWNPQVSLDRGLEKTIEHWKSKLMCAVNN